jgi:hypothetical protein
MTTNGSAGTAPNPFGVQVDDDGNVSVGAPAAGAAGTAPNPFGAPTENQVAVVNLGVPQAPRIIVGLLTDGTPVLYEQRP